MNSKLFAFALMVAVACFLPGELSGVSLAIVYSESFEVNNGVVSTTVKVGKCYNSQYTYYSSKICNSKTDCSNA